MRAAPAPHRRGVCRRTGDIDTSETAATWKRGELVERRGRNVKRRHAGHVPLGSQQSRELALPNPRILGVMDDSDDQGRMCVRIAASGVMSRPTTKRPFPLQKLDVGRPTGDTTGV